MVNKIVNDFTMNLEKKNLGKLICLGVLLCIKSHINLVRMFSMYEHGKHHGGKMHLEMLADVFLGVTGHIARPINTVQIDVVMLSAT